MLQSVLGKVKSEKVKFCHSHEHLFIKKGQPSKVNPALRLDDYAATTKELSLFKKIGGTTIIDAQPLGAGRDEMNLVRAGREKNIDIISSTGFHKFSFYPKNHWLFYYSQKDLTNIFIHELTEGMFLDAENEEPDRFIGNKAGQVKVAIDEERLLDSKKRWFYAAGDASLQTNAPIMCHTETKQQGLYIANFFINLGVKPENIIICHLDRNSNDVNIQKEIAKLGVYLEYDTIGRFKYHSDEEEVKLIKKIINLGFENQLLFGLDSTRERLLSYGGKIGLQYIFKTFIPLLKKSGISDEIILKVMKENPRAAFSKF